MIRLSRRNVLAIGGTGLAGLAATSLTDWAALAYSGASRTRYAADSVEGKEMLQSYARGVQAMKDLPPSSPRSWTFQFYTHWVPGSGKEEEIARIFDASTAADRMQAEAMWQTCRGHSGGNVDWSDQEQWFTPWHRMFVFFFEQIVRDASGNPDFTLPYWDYTASGKNVLPPEFRMPDDPVFGSLYQPNRKGPVNAGQPLDTGNLDCMTRRDFGNAGNVLGFNTSLDRNPHGTIHVNVGDITNMGNVPTAAEDPIFWLHHSNVDRIWASWLAAGGGRSNPTEDAWLDKSFQFSDGTQLVTAQTRDFGTTEQLGYTYSTLLQAPGTAPRPMLLAEAETAQTETMMLRAAGRSTPEPVTLGDSATTITRALPTPPGDANFRSLALSVEPAQRVYLVLRDLRTDLQPGTTYEVLLGLPDTEEAAKPDLIVGQINFFNARASDAEQAANGGLTFSFDVTAAIAQMRDVDPTVDAPQVTIRPSDEPEADARPLVGDVFFSVE